MKKTYKLEKVCCANCAAKMERAVKKIDGVSDASLNFIMQKLTIEAADGIFDQTMEKVERACKKIEPRCRIAL
ncbi:MAG: cation transporter [Oscillospiraceae bacterium]